jgi:hypothetical protein
MENRIFEVYFKGKLLTNSEAIGIGKTIIEFNLKKGDSFFYYPFNFYNDEGTDHKGEKLEYHDVALNIEYINISIVDSWNSSKKIRVKININTALAA